MFKVRIVSLWLCFDKAFSFTNSNLDAANWMQSNMGWLGEKTLKEICIPGTHNSGMSRLFGGTPFAKPCNCLNQSRNIRRQLELGIRFFDVRPVISGGVYKTGHYNEILHSWQGCNGHTIESIVNNINMFNKEHNELIFVRLSHTLNTDNGQLSYRPFTQDEWNNLFEILDKTEHRFHAKKDVYFPMITLEEFTKNGTKPAVIYIIDEQKNNLELGTRTGKGFFYRHSLHIYDQYSATDKIDFMYMDQVVKMKKFSCDRYFLLSWTLTQNSFDTVMCPVAKSTSELALQAKRKLRTILTEVSKAIYPNVISVDYIENTDLAELAMTINMKWLFNKELHSK